MRSQTTSSRKRGRETTPVRTTRLKTGRVHLDLKDSSEIDDDVVDFFVDGKTSPSVIGPDGSTDQPPPSKNRKQQQQQQQVANGFPVTVFPPADNNNSPPPPPPAGPFQSRQHNNKNSSSSSRVAAAAAAKATVRLDNNKPPEPSAAVSRKAEAPPLARRDADEASIRRQQMKEAFQPWVMQTYGDAAKTKTISRRKSERIARILKGEDRSNGADSSKFRFWVRAKGFRLGPPETLSSSSPTTTTTTNPGNQDDDQDAADNDDLYVVTSTTKDESGGEDRPVYKKVAVVEDFFDIIYREHVEFMNNSGGRPATGKHAGQKRTYRAITEIYAFLPREAVTRFLMQCADCQRRGNGAGAVVVVGAVSPPSSTTQLPSPSSTTTTTTLLHQNGVSPGSPTPPASPQIHPTSAPGSTTKQQQQQHHHPLLLPPTPPQSQLMLAVTANNIDLSLPLTSTLLKRATLAGVSHQQLLGLDRAESSFCSAGTSSPQQGMTAGHKVEEESPAKHNSLTHFNVMTSTSNDPTSPITLDLSSKTSDVLMDDHSPGAIKDEDDEDDDDVEDRIDTQDPERLKAFNMFVRLFVDENLDRMVPISRQPREKVQAIIDSCLRQFPEFGERARKRIRTYLKSCRRHKRTRDPSGGLQMDPSISAGSLLSPNTNRPMPPHLTSAIAEQILAQACENENQNAKRLRLGLEPISQPIPVAVGNSETGLVSPTGGLSQQQPPEAHSPASTSTTTSSTTGMTNLFRPAFGPYQRSSNSNSIPTTTSIHQGPTDLSTKSRPSSAILGPPTSNGLSSRSSPLPHKLNAAEILAVRQLVTGYRESAAFLLRSADELEQLLHQQHATL